MDKTANFRGIGTTEEHFDVLSTSGQKTGQTKPRSEVHRDGDWHQAVLVWLVNSKNEVLLQRRTPDKDSHPNQLDTSCGGHVVAGETVIETAVAELKEELGLTAQPEDLEFIAHWKETARPGAQFMNNCFYTCYLWRADFAIAEMTPQAEEISELIYIPVAQFCEMVRRRDSELAGYLSAEILLRYLNADE